AAATSLRVIVDRWGPNARMTSRPRANASMKSGPVSPRIIPPDGTSTLTCAHGARENTFVFPALIVAETVLDVQISLMISLTSIRQLCNMGSMDDCPHSGLD